MLPKIRHIHFVGIGGIGMSGIAELLVTLGYTVTGSDLKRSLQTRHLAKRGAKIVYTHKAENIIGAHVVVVSSAVRLDNPEWIAAKRAGIPVIQRAEMLAELMRVKHGIAVAGSHGKTTTTSLVGHLLHRAGLDPTLVIGGRVKSLRSNARLGRGDFLVAEADESDGSFMRLSPSFALLTNIDPEHLDYYRTFEALKTAFIDFANKVPFYGAVVACQDHPVIREILPSIKRRLVTYGFSASADFYPENIQTRGLSTHFEVWSRTQGILGSIHLKLMGRHNVLNALGSLALALELGIPFETIAKAFTGFRGIERRMEVLFKGKDFWVIDDYGHHPAEICATLDAIRDAFPERRRVVLFQPHRYTRTRDLFDEFQAAFNGADLLFLTEIYAAGEDAIPGVTGQALAAAIQEKTQKPVVFVSDTKDLPALLKNYLNPKDLIVTLGAGDIVKISKKLASQLRGATKSKKREP